MKHRRYLRREATPSKQELIVLQKYIIKKDQNYIEKKNNLLPNSLLEC